MNTTPKKRRSKFIPARLPKTTHHKEKTLALLQKLHPDNYGILTTNQLIQLCFKRGSESYCNEVLRSLFHKPLQLVNRHPLSFKGGKNNATLAYTLTYKGSQLLFENGLGRLITPQKAYKMKNNTIDYREHERGLNDVRIALETGVKLIGAEVMTWITDRDFRTPAYRSQLKVKDAKTQKIFSFQPDGFFVLRLKTGELKPFFLEYDNNTMFHSRFRNVKIRGYHLLGDVWRTLEMFQKYKDIPVTYRVLTITSGGQDRAFNFKTLSAEALFKNDKDKTRNTKRFYFTELSKISPGTIFTQPIWFIPFRSKTKDQRYLLF